LICYPAVKRNIESFFAAWEVFFIIIKTYYDFIFN